MQLRNIAIDDKYTREDGQIFVTGTQALVRLAMLQSQRDQRAGLNTAGFVTGYRGSPLGGLDQQLYAAQEHLDRHGIRFQPAVNEDLGATAVWGTQQSGINADSRYDGVFAMWYAKGPGVDRSGDPIRHGNLAGSSQNGGVLLLLGDDHTCESSTTAHQSEYSLVNTMVPILNPAGVQDILDFGLYGWALSRFSGCWVGLKCVHDTVEASASVSISSQNRQLMLPHDFTMPEGGLNIRWPDTFQAQEERLQQYKLNAVAAYSRANPIDRQVLGSEQAHTGLVTTGKSYLDVRRALLELGIDEQRAQSLGLKVYKVGMVWPLESQGLKQFAQGLKHLIVVEEKRGLMEQQIKEILYASTNRPEVIGKFDENGKALFQAYGRLEAMDIALAVGDRLVSATGEDELALRLKQLRSRKEEAVFEVPAMIRTPYFCAGCPHNSSTVVPDGSRAMAGIGCHFMAVWMDRNTAGFTQMGGEGASWNGEALFSETNHVFQNIGDGTYFHSGLLAIRASVAAGVNVTFKILYNDAVAMTGGQQVDGVLDPARITRQVHAEGVSVITVVSDQPDKYPRSTEWAPGVTIHHRQELEKVQLKLRQEPGTTVIVFDQTCAAEKRRRRRRGTMPMPEKRLYINEMVCEGCGDCGEQSNCVAVVPKETVFGRKRGIHQSACNLDYACKRGFCPSFVTVVGGSIRKGQRQAEFARFAGSLLLEPDVSPMSGNFSILLTGVGGTGVVTVGAIIGMAAHLAGKGVSVLDMAGLAQKGGAVATHIVLAETPDDITATHVADGGADLLLGCDVVTSASVENLIKMRDGTTAVINSYQLMSGGFTHDPDSRFPLTELLTAISERTGSSRLRSIDSTTVATAAFGDALASNLIILGYGFQLGGIPLPSIAIERAIELNGRSVEMNLQAFRLGRAAAARPEEIRKLLNGEAADNSQSGLAGVDDLVASNQAFLVRYQNRRYGERYRAFVDRARVAEKAALGEASGFTKTVAAAYFKLLAAKDEYEVARLYSDSEFLDRVHSEFEGDFSLRLHFAPPILCPPDPDTGIAEKKEFGPWVFVVLKLLAAMRRLRGTLLDPFRYSQDRAFERSIVTEYEESIIELNGMLNVENHAAATEIAALPLTVRGFGHVKARHAAQARVRYQELREILNETSSNSSVAA